MLYSPKYSSQFTVVCDRLLAVVCRSSNQIKIEQTGVRVFQTGLLTQILKLACKYSKGVWSWEFNEALKPKFQITYLN